MKRSIPAAVMAVLLAVLCAASAVAGRGPWFSDLDQGDPNYPYIVELAQSGVMEGRADGSFGVHEPVSRREAMELLLAAIDAEGAPLAQAAVEHKLVYTFDPEALDEPVTRLETAQMAARALDLLPLAGESPYTDCEDGYVVKLWEKGVWDSGACFRPGEAMTRGELASLLWHMERADVSVEAFRYNNYWVETLEGVPLYQYDLLDFSIGEDGVTYVGEEYTALRGVDVSGFQGDIDWEAVRADGMDFAMVRVGGRFINSGGLYDDSKFESNVEGALNAGLQVGAYFFSQAISAEEGAEEAEYVLARLKDYDITMPVVIDWEYLGGDEARTYGVEPEQVTDGIEAFCRLVREAGYTPMVYINGYCGYIKMDLRRLAGTELWFAQYTNAPEFTYHFTMWQYTNQGRVDGISGDVDLNLYFLPN